MALGTPRAPGNQPLEPSPQAVIWLDLPARGIPLHVKTQVFNWRPMNTQLSGSHCSHFISQGERRSP